MKFSSMRLTSVRGVHEYIMHMRDIVAQLKNLEVEMLESFLVHYIMNTFPQQYGPFLYNTYKDGQSINKLMTMCIKEEWRLVMELGENIMLATRRQDKT
jgi:ionotropic glutamate receptor